MDDISDEALVEMFRRGDRRAEVFGLLLERALPVIHARADAAIRRAGPNCRIPRDDLLQEGTLGFLSAVTAYQAQRGASLRTFISVCVSNRLDSALRKGSKLPSEEELLDTALPPGCESMDPQDVYAAMEDARRLQDVMQRQLTELERGVLEAWMDSERYEAIAKRLGVPVKTVDNALQRARRKLQRFL